MSRKANRVRKNVATTNLGTKVTTRGNEITLETPKATVTNIREAKRDLGWLAADVFSTPSAYRA